MSSTVIYTSGSAVCAIIFIYRLHIINSLQDKIVFVKLKYFDI